jgi:hypothetical protein
LSLGRGSAICRKSKSLQFHGTSSQRAAITRPWRARFAPERARAALPSKSGHVGLGAGAISLTSVRTSGHCTCWADAVLPATICSSAASWSVPRSSSASYARSAPRPKAWHLRSSHVDLFSTSRPMLRTREAITFGRPLDRFYPARRALASLWPASLWPASLRIEQTSYVEHGLTRRMAPLF